MSFDLFDAVGFDVCEFEVVEELPNDCTREQLLWRERWYIENCPCVNKLIPIRTDEEKNERILYRSNEWKANNADRVKEINRLYRQRKKAEKAELAKMDVASS